MAKINIIKVNRSDKRGDDISLNNSVYLVHDGKMYNEFSLNEIKLEICKTLNLKWGDRVKTRKTGVKVKKINKWVKKK